MPNFFRMSFLLSALVCTTALLGVQPAAAQSPDLTALSLEDLLDSGVRPLSLKDQDVFRTAAAVFVVTRQDIEQSGARTVPDMLRMVPGFTVARINASSWAVTSRGFNGLYANKLLVLIDGRSVSSPTFGGVDWDMVNVPIGNIDRIEVIRGPGGALWTGNAVNGVVNIITRRADERQGPLVNGAIGAPGQGSSDVYFGGRAGNTHYSVFGKYTTNDSGRSNAEIEDVDKARVRLGGVRLDWRGDVSNVSVRASVQDGSATRTQFEEGNVVLAWRYVLSSRADIALQASYQAYHRATGAFGETWRVLNIDSRWRRAIGRHHDINVGTGYRLASGRIANTPTMMFSVANEQLHTVSGFVHDNIRLAEDVWVTAGSKFEHNEYTGAEVQPTLRATWLPNARQAVWLAASRAVRTPSKLDREARLTLPTTGVDGMPLTLQVEADAAFRSETLRAFEAGYRIQRQRASVDVTAFRNGYQHLRGAAAGAPLVSEVDGMLTTTVPILMTNLLNASAVGLEVVADWRPLGWLRWNGSQAWMSLEGRADADVTIDRSAGRPVPVHQSRLRSIVELPANIEVTASLYRMSSVDAKQIPASNALDLHVQIDLGDDLEFSAGARDLLHHGTREFYEYPGVNVRPIRRSVFAGFEWDF